ncbi:hypothetical protein I6E29_00640 [Arcanobacterium haemolyticum]|nr:hypothetical protein [Arcanobacterium haemolyticum]
MSKADQPLERWTAKDTRRYIRLVVLLSSAEILISYVLYYFSEGVLQGFIGSEDFYELLVLSPYNFFASALIIFEEKKRKRMSAEERTQRSSRLVLVALGGMVFITVGIAFFF